MKFTGKTTYNKFDFKKVPFLRQEKGAKGEDKVFNGNFDVTDAADHLHGVRTGEEDVRLLDYLVYRPLPKQLKELGTLPNVHPQSYEMQLYYRKLFRACTEGITIGKEYFNPFFVFWLTIFTFEIPLYDKNGNMLEGSEIGKPLYSVIDRYIFDIMWKGYKLRKYVPFMSGRGIGKSFITSSIEGWYYLLFDGQEMIVSATSDPIVEEAWSKTTDTLRLLEKEYPGFRQKKVTDSNIKILAGEEYYDANNDLVLRGSLNEIRRIVYGDNANKTRGRRPHFQHIEEFASFPSHPGKGSLKNVLGQSKGSWIIMGSFKKAFVILTGTGGSVDNKDAEDVFTNPKGFNMLPINEWGMETGLFIPSQLKYGGTWESTGVPNVELATRLMTEERKNLEKDPVAYQQELQEFPMNLQEVFIVQGTNIFNQDKLLEQATKLKITAEKPWKEGRIDYILDKDGSVVGAKFVEVRGGDIIIIEEPELGPDGKVMNKLYVAGIDSIDQGKKDSLIEGSELAVAVKKRVGNSMFSSTSNIYVAFYAKRSDDVRWDYENALKICILYNAKANVEYTKINIVSFYRAKNQFWRLLQRPSIAIGANVSGLKASQLIGTPATSSVIDHQDQKLADYIDDYYYHILYPPVIAQLQEYSRENRTKFDYVVAMGLAELADEEYMGKPASSGGTAAEDLAPFGMYRDARGRKRWGVIPEEKEEIRSIALEEATGAEPAQPFEWVEATAIDPK